MSRKKNLTGFKGVYLTPYSKYQAQINIRLHSKKITICLGTFSNPEEAYIVRLKYLDSLK